MTTEPQYKNRRPNPRANVGGLDTTTTMTDDSDTLRCSIVRLWKRLTDTDARDAVGPFRTAGGAGG